MALESRWLKASEYVDKINKFPHVIFCNYTPPFPEDNLRCSAPALMGGRCLSCARIEIFYRQYDLKMPICFPTNDQIFKEIARKYGPRRISLEVYDELKRLNVKVCSFIQENTKYVCGAPLSDDRAYCLNCSTK